MDNVAMISNNNNITYASPCHPDAGMLPVATMDMADRQHHKASHFSCFVSKAAYIEMKQSANYWKSLHQKSQAIHDRLRQENLELKAAHKKALKERDRKIASLEAKVKLREKQLFGKKSEQQHKSEKTEGASTKKPRGQQRGSKGHGRSNHGHLPQRHESADLSEEEKICCHCQQPFKEFGEENPDTVEIIEVEVAAHKRIIRKSKYKKMCQCSATPGVVSAVAPARLIHKSLLGHSVWIELMLSKYHYYTPHARLLRQWKDTGLNLAAGTITGGLKSIATAYFSPVYQALQERSRLSSHWHADETRWEVYATPVEGKESSRWYLWVFRCQEVVVYFLDPSRSQTVPRSHLQGCAGILSVDRYSAYKAFVKGTLILLAYCWAHVRRDFLDLAKKYPGQQAWAMSFVEAIGELYHLNKLRLEALDDSKAWPIRQAALDDALDRMAQRAANELQRLQAIKTRTAGETACLKVLKSLVNHWSGLTIFSKHPEIPMDNNLAENSLRGAVVLRNGCRGAGSQWSGNLMAMAMSIFRTLEMHHLNVRTWLTHFFHACAAAGRRLPDNWQQDFLPWEMTEARKKQMAAPLQLHEDSS